ncbi:MAG: hypothetical protein AABY81_05965 [Pseudomonadota bacterium]
MSNHFIAFLLNIPAGVFIVLAFLIAILGAFSVQRFIAFRTASVKFRSAVLGILSGLYPIPANWPSSGSAVDQILRVTFPALQTAVTEFKDSLPRRHRRAFDQAWFICRLGSDGREIDKQCYHQYMGFSSPDKVIPDSKVTFHANVSLLLRFAKET